MSDEKWKVVEAQADEVSFVGAGANDEEFLLFKSQDDETGSDDVTKSQTEGGDDDLGDDITREDVAEFLKEADDLEDLLDEAGVELEKEEEDPEPAEYDLPDEVKAQLEKAEELEDKLEKEREKRRTREYMEKARDKWSDVTIGDVRKKAELMKDVDDHLPEDSAELLHKIIDGLQEQLQDNELFKEYGTSYSNGTSDALEKIEKMAQERFEDGEYDSLEKAKNAVLQENPDLYEEYRREAQV